MLLPFVPDFLPSLAVCPCDVPLRQFVRKFLPHFDALHVQFFKGFALFEDSVKGHGFTSLKYTFSPFLSFVAQSLQSAICVPCVDEPTFRSAVISTTSLLDAQLPQVWYGSTNSANSTLIAMSDTPTTILAFLPDRQCTSQRIYSCVRFRKAFL